jgi:hypothetical protein
MCALMKPSRLLHQLLPQPGVEIVEALLYIGLPILPLATLMTRSIPELRFVIHAIRDIHRGRYRIDATFRRIFKEKVMRRDKISRQTKRLYYAFSYLACSVLGCCCQVPEIFLSAGRH